MPMQTDSLVSCDSAVWNGNVYTASGIYVDTLPNVHGCDSNYIGRTINNSIATTDSITACDSVVWNGNVYTVVVIQTL